MRISKLCFKFFWGVRNYFSKIYISSVVKLISRKPMIKIPGSVELQALRTVTPNVWGQGKMDVQLKQRVNLPFLWLFSSVSPSDGMTEWFPPALVCATFFTQIIKSVLISSFNNQLKLLVRSILPFLWLSLWVSEWTYNLLYWLF